MTMIPIKKQCPLCKKYYSWNPDVGKVFCPYCREGKKSILDVILNKKYNKKG